MSAAIADVAATAPATSAPARLSKRLKCVMASLLGWFEFRAMVSDVRNDARWNMGVSYFDPEGAR
jgi:hypothetical protein